MFHEDIGLIIVDHGSSREESNKLFEKMVLDFAENLKSNFVIAAHMECGSPSIHEAFERLAKQGIKKVMIHPFFLLPGKHLQEDIPKLCQEAAKNFPDVMWKITEPTGRSDLILQAMREIILQNSVF